MIPQPGNVIEFKLPKKPRVKEKDPTPDQRKVAVMPIRALQDKQLTDGMFRILALVCSYCNRAGVTWVSQLRLSQDAGVSRQAISKQLKKLKESGYVEVVSRHYRGIRPDTMRVVFDPTIDTETAIAVTSRNEDTRPPYMKEEQMNDMTPDPEGLRRIQEMIKGVVKPITQPPKEYTMPKSGDTVTVAKMKAEIAAKKARHKQPNKVAPSDEKVGNTYATYAQPNEVEQNTERTTKEEYIKVFIKHKIKGLTKEEVLRLSSVQPLTIEQLDADIAMLLNLYQGEGLPIPQPGVLIDSIMQLHRDAGRTGDAV